MTGVYKTPGVYVEEIPKFPPSIAPVETAIPAFIGYTEKAMKNGEDVTDKAVRIESIAEYELIFGGAPSQDVKVVLDTNNQFVKAEAEAKLFMYDSLRMFYANGGGNCYIISVGPYPNDISTVNSSAIESALEVLKKEDEPTIIIAPDVVSTSSGPYGFQQKALDQCQNLKDRVALCDLVHDTDFDNSVSNFRDNIGINYLKYGAAYGPWLQASLPRRVLYKNLQIIRHGTNTSINLENLTTDPQILAMIADLKIVTETVATLQAVFSNGADGALQAALDAYAQTDGLTSPAGLSTALKGITDVVLKALAACWNVHEISVPANSNFTIEQTIDAYLANTTLKDTIKNLVAHHKALAPPATFVAIDVAHANFIKSAQLLGYNGANPDQDLLNDITLPVVTLSGTNKEKADKARNAAYSAALEAISIFNFVQSSVNAFEKSMNDTLLASFGKFKELSVKAAEALNLLPPSGAVAGVYAATDRERGVWKAPANVSLNAVIGPSVTISHEDQAGYNVDVNAGKSINIIRAFTGKGTLVWGARTLAGNDNEWRYISVRRFFNFVEESVKKATEQFVFEPNDANTWVRVQAMIENFLTTLWRQGALQGVKPEHAFYVAVGLGKTMTPLDILEGRMIIEIGMAAVRPAEFIILRFSHKMAES